jgi:CheY-like chemotaxis protein
MSRVFDLLIVDDDPGQIEHIRARLCELSLPYRCHYVPNREQALDFLKRKSPFEDMPRPNLILLSLHLPDGAGYDVMRLIKSDAAFRSIPLIVVSAPQRLADLETAPDSGQAYLQGAKAHDLTSSLNLLTEIDRFWGNVAQPYG